jgi:hypothetical protein
MKKASVLDAFSFKYPNILQSFPDLLRPFGYGTFIGLTDTKYMTNIG